MRKRACCGEWRGSQMRQLAEQGCLGGSWDILEYNAVLILKAYFSFHFCGKIRAGSTVSWFAETDKPRSSVSLGWSKTRRDGFHALNRSKPTLHFDLENCRNDFGQGANHDCAILGWNSMRCAWSSAKEAVTMIAVPLRPSAKEHHCPQRPCKSAANIQCKSWNLKAFKWCLGHWPFVHCLIRSLREHLCLINVDWFDLPASMAGCHLPMATRR